MGKDTRKELLMQKYELFTKFYEYSQRQALLIEEEAWDRLININDAKELMIQRIDRVEKNLRQELEEKEERSSEELEWEEKIQGLIGQCMLLDNENTQSIEKKKLELANEIKEVQTQKKAQNAYTGGIERDGGTYIDNKK